MTPDWKLQGVSSLGLCLVFRSRGQICNQIEGYQSRREATFRGWSGKLAGVQAARERYGLWVLLSHPRRQTHSRTSVAIVRYLR